MNIQKREQVLKVLGNLGITYELHEHPPVPTVEDALPYWEKIDATHCKNLFFRNHKGNRHYLVILRHDRELRIHDLEKKLKQGKLSFASPERMERYLGLSGGSVSLFGIINDRDNHVYLFLDEALKKAEKISFHPNENTATLVIPLRSFMKFLEWSGNGFEFLRLYEPEEG